MTENLHVAIIGSSGVGKSTLINTLRGLRPGDPGSAAVGIIETTRVPTSYPHPQNNNLVLWDLPGVGTPLFPKDSYLNNVGYTKFHAFLIISSTRFTENDLFLADSLRRLNREYIFVRSKVDIDIRNEEEDHPGQTKSEIMSKLRQNIAGNLRNSGIYAENGDIFLVNGKKDNELEFQELVNNITNKFTNRREDIINSIKDHNSSWCNIL